MSLDRNIPATWDEARQLGQLFMMGFDGTTVNDQLRSLIVTHHVGSILLTAKNFESVQQATQLILDLQTLAQQAGHPVPLLIVIDQENGGVNSLYDESYIRQFPSAMALADTGDRHLARRVAKATAEELKSCGINWVLGPVLDVLTNARNQPLGVRSFGEDPAVVSSFGVENVRGLQEGGVATCGKHFPSYGNLEFFGAPTDVPTITDSLENLSQNALVPFKHAIDAGIDAMMVGGVAMSSNHINVMHACLSEQICRDLLRTEMKFQGVIVSECLEMEALSRNIGISGGTVMAFQAGCDIMLTCRTMSVQEDAISGLTAGLENGMIEREKVQESWARILALKEKYTSWEKAFLPLGVANLDRLRNTHASLSLSAYTSTVRIVRDEKNYLPLTKTVLAEDEILLLTPLVKPLPASAAFRNFIGDARAESLSPRPNYTSDNMVMAGERVFRNFGRLLARRRNGKIMHASYTANGLRPQHEILLQRAKAVIVLTADAGRNKYQVAFAKHVAMLCRIAHSEKDGLLEKPCVVTAVSSPFDFISETSIGTYICTYDFTETALQSLADVLYGNEDISRTLDKASTIKDRRLSQHTRQQWLVEAYKNDRDNAALNKLLAAASAKPKASSILLKGVSSDTFLVHHELIEEAHFVVRNSSTKELIGFCATYYQALDRTASIGAIIVHPERRHQSVGHSLHDRAIRWFKSKSESYILRLGTRLPSVFMGLPSTDLNENYKLSRWFTKLGWTISDLGKIYVMSITDLPNWNPPDGLGQSLTVENFKYDLVHGEEYSKSVMGLVRVNAPVDVQAVYDMALKDKSGCAIIRGKRTNDNSIVAAVVLYWSSSRLATFAPTLRNEDGIACRGDIGSPVIAAPEDDRATLLSGLILLGIRRLKKQGVKTLYLNHVDDPSMVSRFQGMGFQVHQTFDKVQSVARNWT